MALIYRCDKCGSEHVASGIVANLHKQYGYEQLRNPIGSIVDVCKPCYMRIISAHLKAKVEKQKSLRGRTLEILGFAQGDK